MRSKLIIALHGFLGLPSDWDAWKACYLATTDQFWAPDLWSHPLLNSSFCFEEWTQNFSNLLEEKNSQGFDIELWGYSLGGRLALHAIDQISHLITKAVILSSHPGLESNEAKELRLHQDQLWYQKFLSHQNWANLMEDWNNQSLFIEDGLQNVDKSVYRLEGHYSRQALALAFKNWSLGHQKNFWPCLGNFKCPIHWHVGALDSKFLEIIKRASSLNPLFTKTIHPQRGHRLLLNLDSRSHKTIK